MPALFFLNLTAVRGRIRKGIAAPVAAWYIRGSKEFEDSGEFRTRLAALGDFVHSLSIAFQQVNDQI